MPILIEFTCKAQTSKNDFATRCLDMRFTTLGDMAKIVVLQMLEPLSIKF